MHWNEVAWVIKINNSFQELCLYLYATFAGYKCGFGNKNTSMWATASQNKTSTSHGVDLIYRVLIVVKSVRP